MDFIVQLAEAEVPEAVIVLAKDDFRLRKMMTQTHFVSTNISPRMNTHFSLLGFKFAEKFNFGDRLQQADSAL